MNTQSLSSTAIGRLDFSAHEPDALTEHGRTLSWNAEYLATGRAFHADVVAAQMPGLQIIRIGFDAPSIAVGEPPLDHYVFAIPEQLRGHTCVGGEALDGSRLGIFQPGREYQFHTELSAAFVLIAVNREFVDRISRAQWGRSLEETSSRSVWRVADPPGMRGLSAACLRHLERPTTSPGVLARAGLGSDRAERLVEGLITRLQPRNDRSPMRHTSARRAEAFLRSNWRRPLRLADICKAADVPERTLRQGFLELYGRSPTTYLRLLRHRVVRATLQQADAGRISDIALACGFRNLGDFAVEYHRLFGETPSATRRAARRFRDGQGRGGLGRGGQGAPRSEDATRPLSPSGTYHTGDV